MDYLVRNILIFLQVLSVFCQSDDEFLYGTFPRGFLWGASTSAYQIEGGWNSDGKGQSIWDDYTHHKNGELISDNSNGDIACDSYNKIQADVKILKDLGVNFYRFSVSWPRIVPTGRVRDGVNQAGIEYYNTLINALIAENIQPFVTLYHWDLPLALRLTENGGWLNETIVDHFGDYARLLFRSYGDRVKLWLTLNEPWMFCLNGWNYGYFGWMEIEDRPEKAYICGIHAIKAHATAYRIYEREFRLMQRGQVGISLNSIWAEPKNQNDPNDQEASRRAMQFYFGWFAHPIVHGEYPPEMRALICEKDAAAGRNQCRLPEITPRWRLIIRNSTDFLGVNHYASQLLQPVFANDCPGIEGDANVFPSSDPKWSVSEVCWPIVPWGFRKLLTWTHENYRKPIYITENGYGSREREHLSDEGRKEYYRRYINEVMKAVRTDGANIRGYSAWSLMDNFEWTAGYTARFGTYYVNFTHAERTRTAKASSVLLTNIFKDNGFPRNSSQGQPGSFPTDTGCPPPQTNRTCGELFRPIPFLQF